MFRKKHWIFAVLLLLQGCGKEPQLNGSGQEKADEGRPETANIRATDAIGVDGTNISKKVDAALDINDQRKEELDKAMEAQ